MPDPASEISLPTVFHKSPTDINHNITPVQSTLAVTLRSLCPKKNKGTSGTTGLCEPFARCNYCRQASSAEMASRNKNAARVNRGGGGEVYQTLYGPGEMEQYIKLAVGCYNQMNPDRPIELKDVHNNLNSSIMCALVSFLLKELDESFSTEPQTSTLPEFEQLGLTNGPYVYDSTVEHLFIEASKYFNLQDDVLHMGLLLCPERNVKRAKHVIAWLAAYVLFMDHFGETFQNSYEEMTQEIEKKAELYNEIEEIKNNIAMSIVESHERENSLPKIENELKDVDRQIQAAQAELHKLEAIACKEKANYDSKAQEARHMEEKLREMDLEKAALEDQLVHSAADVLQTHMIEKNKFKEATMQRAELGRELQELGLEEQTTVLLMDRMKISLENFEGLMAFVNRAGDSIAAVNKAAAEMQIRHKEKDELRQEFKSFQEEVAKRKSEVDQRNQEAASNLRALMDAIKRTEEEQETTTFRNLELHGEIQELRKQNSERQKELDDRVATIHEYTDFFEKYQRNFNVGKDWSSMVDIFGLNDKADDDEPDN